MEIGSNLWSWQRAQATERPRNALDDDVDLVVHVVGDHLVLVDVAGHEVGDGQQPRGDQAVLVDPARPRRRQEVAGNLVPDEIGGTADRG